MTRVGTCLWYESEGLEAATFYTSLLPNSEITRIDRADPDKPPILVQFTLMGTPYAALSPGEAATHSHAASITVEVDTQEEIDRLWQAMLDNGGEEVECGWIKDRWRISWQIFPAKLPEMMFHGDRDGGQRAYQAMLGMKKLDLAALQAAYDGKESAQ